MPSVRQAIRRAARGVAGLLLVALALLALQNALLNLGLPWLLNRRPERLRIVYDYAWMLIPGEVNVRGLQIRVQGLADQWLLTADDASGVIHLTGLLERRFHAGELRASGVSFRHRRRLDAEAPDDAPASPSTRLGPAEEVEAARVETSKAPPIPGLHNPPDPNPERIYPKRPTPWLIRLDDLIAEDVREIWLSDYHLTGAARVTADFSLADPFLDVVGTVSIPGMRADIGDTPVAQDIVGELSFLVDCMDRKSAGTDRVQAITVAARVGADVEDLRFLDFYLASVPWLSLSGVGHVDLDVRLQAGEFSQKSYFNADFPNLVVRVLSNDVSGSGRINAEVGQGPDGEPQTRLAVEFDDFAITPDGSTGALAEGTGFRIAAESPDVALDQPFTSLSVEVDLPESRIPDFAMYNAYLPTSIGLALRQGSGTARGNLMASSLDSRASGDLYLAGKDIEVQFDEFAFTGDMALHARLAEAQLDTGRYDLSGSTLNIRRAGLIDETQSHVRDGQRRWSASLEVASGVVQVGAPVYLDTSLRMTCSDSVPFVRLFTKSRSLPQWVQKRLSMPHLSGSARLKVGENTLAIAPARIRSGDYQLDLRFFRNGRSSHGDLLVSVKGLSVGVALSPSGPKLKLFGAKRWFSQPGGASP